MNKITSTQTNYTAAAAGYAEGTFKDDPGDGTGSSIIVKNFNDVWYALATPILKYLGALADTDEKTTQSDFQDSIERMVGVQNENVGAYASGTTYSADDHVMHLGVQFVSMVGSNTGNDPFDNPDKWLPCYNRDEAILKHRNCDVIQGGLEDIHNHRDAGYRQYFKWGKYNYGGDSGRNFQAYGIHLDGTIVTGGPLATILDVGGADEYPYLDIIAPDVAGTRTLLDTRGAVAAAIDATGGSREDVGVYQDDAFQGHDRDLASSLGGSNIVNDTYGTGASLSGQGMGGSTLATRNTVITSNYYDDGTNGTPRVDDETRMKNYSVGVASVLVFVEI